MKIDIDQIYKEVAEDLNMPLTHVSIIGNSMFRFMKQEMVEKNTPKSLLIPYLAKFTIKPYLKDIIDGDRPEEHT